MSKLGWSLAGAGAVLAGVAISKPSRDQRHHRRHYRRFRHRYGIRVNPGAIERELLRAIREYRNLIEELRSEMNPKAATIDAEFVPPIPADGTDPAHSASPEATKK